GGRPRRASATDSVRRRSSTSRSRSRFRAARYSADSPGKAMPISHLQIVLLSDGADRRNSSRQIGRWIDALSGDPEHPGSICGTAYHRVDGTLFSDKVTERLVVHVVNQHHPPDVEPRPGSVHLEVHVAGGVEAVMNEQVDCA